MVRLRKWLGGCALLVLVIALNLLVWTQQFFSALVLLPLAAAAVLGFCWFAMLLMSMIEHRALEDRTVGSLGILFSTAVFLGICIVLYLFLGAWSSSWDLTREGRRSLSPQTVQVLQAMNTGVEVFCYFPLVEDDLVVIARDKTLRFLDLCRQHTPLIKVQVLDPAIDRASLEAMNVTHVSVQGTVVLRAGERQRVIKLSGGSPRLEERDFTNALINVLRKSEPKVYFMTGHQERDITDEDPQKGGSILGNLLKGEAYLAERLAVKISAPEIPADADIIVINNPVMDFHPAEMEALESFIGKGGRLLLLIDPWRTPAPGQGVAERLLPWFEARFGIKIGNDIVCTDLKTKMTEADLTVDNTPFETAEENPGNYRGAYSLKHPITRSFDQSMLLQAARSVSLAPKPPEGAAAVEILRTTPDFGAETDIEKLLQTRQVKWDEGDRRGPVPLGVAAAVPVDKAGNPRGLTDARVVVIGDADFAANASIIVPGHLNFLLNTFAWLSESEDLIAMRPTGRESQPLILAPVQQRAIAWVSIMLTIQLVLVAGLCVYFVRRRHQ